MRDVPPVCVFCNNAILTARHVFVECQALRAIRQRVLTGYVGMNYNVATILGKNIDVASVFTFFQ